MSKRRPSFDTRQLSLDLAATPTRGSDSELAGIEKRVASAVALILKRDARNRYQIAGEVSRILDDEVTKLMLDAYAAEGRENYNISAGRFLALVAVTGSFDVLREFCLEIGADLVMGDEILTVELGNIAAMERELAERKKAIRGLARPIRRINGGKK